MDSKNVKNPRLANLLLSSLTLAAAVQDIPGAVINSGNVEITLSEFGPNAQVIEARFEDEIASLSETAGVATLNFATGLTATSVILVSIKSPIQL